MMTKNADKKREQMMMFRLKKIVWHMEKSR